MPWFPWMVPKVNTGTQSLQSPVKSYANPPKPTAYAKSRRCTIIPPRLRPWATPRTLADPEVTSGCLGVSAVWEAALKKEPCTSIPPKLRTFDVEGEPPARYPGSKTASMHAASEASCHIWFVDSDGEWNASSVQEAYLSVSVWFTAKVAGTHSRIYKLLRKNVGWRTARGGHFWQELLQVIQNQTAAGEPIDQ